jgi:signal transduction histidine kinase
VEVSEIPEDLMIECRPTPISQVLLNILNNAFDAIEKMDHRWVRIECVDIGSQVVIRLIDSGPGIREDLRAKILEPFFTTKEVGKGTGLGLSIAHGIVRAHNGKIEIDSSCPNTCFQITLPKYQTS